MQRSLWPLLITNEFDPNQPRRSSTVSLSRLSLRMPFCPRTVKAAVHGGGNTNRNYRFTVLISPPFLYGWTVPPVCHRQEIIITYSVERYLVPRSKHFSALQILLRDNVLRLNSQALSMIRCVPESTQREDPAGRITSAVTPSGIIRSIRKQVSRFQRTSISPCGVGTAPSAHSRLDG